MPRTTSSALPYERQANELALVIWDQLRDRSEADRRLVYEALQRRINVAVMTERQELALYALQCFLDRRREAKAAVEQKLDVSDGPSDDGDTLPVELPRWAQGEPGRDRYESFRACQSKRSEWPSAQLIRNAFGDWRKALAAVGYAPAEDVTTRRLTARGFMYSETEIMAVLETWKAEVDAVDPTASLLKQELRLWCDAELARPEPRFTRLPSDACICRHVGDWDQVLLRLGCPDRGFARHKDPSLAAPSANTGGQATPGKKSALEKLSDLEGLDLQSMPGDCGPARPAAENLQWLSWIGAQLRPADEARLTQEEHDALGRQITVAAGADGLLLRVPSAKRYRQIPKIGSWSKAKRLAGLTAVAGNGKRTGIREGYSEKENGEAVVAAVKECGPTVTQAGYGSWRERRLRRLRAAGQDQRVPSVSAIRKCFGPSGDWSYLIEAGLDKYGDAEDE